MDLGRIVLGIFLFVFLVAYYAWKWKRAGVVSEAMDAERLAARQSFELIKQDPRFFTLQRYLNTRYRTVFDRTTDPVTYCIRYVGFMDGNCKYIFLPNEAGARYLLAYLERGDNPTRLQVSLDLHTGVCGEVELSWLAWSAVRPWMD